MIQNRKVVIVANAINTSRDVWLTRVMRSYQLIIKRQLSNNASIKFHFEQGSYPNQPGQKLNICFFPNCSSVTHDLNFYLRRFHTSSMHTPSSPHITPNRIQLPLFRFSFPLFFSTFISLTILVVSLSS